ncbi:MAG: lysophospholipase [Anaerolineae bacterium]|nr:lysophospholipase [Anaerolineae bacterium]
MKTITDILCTPDGLRLHTIRWLPDHDEIRAVVLLVHGINEHSGRYTHVAQALTDQHYAVYALDHRGHGRSEGPRVFFPRFEYAVNDQEIYFEQVRATNPGRPIFVYGHSMGALIAPQLTLRRQADIAGLIITGTPLALESKQLPLMVWLGGTLEKFIPHFKLPGISSANLTRDTTRVEAFDRDPLNHHGGIPVRSAYQLIEQSRLVRQQLHLIELPLLVMHGTDDPICPSSGSQIAYDQASSADKSLKFYPGMYHEIHNEIGKEQVLTDIVTWLDQHSTMESSGS